MRILFLGNNWVGWQVVQWLKEQGEDIVGLVLHPPEKAKYRQEIVETARLDPARVFDGARLREAETLAALEELRPEIAISGLFGYILRQEFLDIIPLGCINIHPALLPYNRGANPNIWCIVERTPAGATLHYVDAGVDTGDIICQSRIQVAATDTGETLYHKLNQACLDLFKENWALIRAGEARRTAQSPQEGTVHRVRDVEKIDELDLERTYTAREMIDVIRARTFPPYAGAYFRNGGRKVYLRLQLIPEEELS